MQLKELWDRERENLTMLILTFLSYLILNKFDIQKTKEVGCILLIYIIWIGITFLIEKSTIPRHIKIKPSKEYYNEKFNNLTNGKKWYGYLTVEIPSNWIITDCYITLERAIPVYYEDKILIDRKHSEWYSNQTKPKYKKLQWRSPSSYENNTKINIGENLNQESFSVGKIVTGKFGENEIKAFNFDVHQINPASINIMHLGLYEFTIKFHWKRNGRQMIPKEVDGYIYSRAEGGIREIRVRLGDYNNDNDIPKPLFKIEEDDEQSNK